VASIRARRRANGTTSYAVLWRDPQTGRQTSLTYDDERQAVVARQLIEAAGGQAIEAARIAEAVQAAGPLLTDVVTEHIDLLTGIGPDTRAHYRTQLRAHIDPVIGGLPVKGLTYRHVAGWVQAMTAKGLVSRVKKMAGFRSMEMSGWSGRPGPGGRAVAGSRTGPRAA
jgi:hypothetical protein